ncbi:hypothetical protein BSKO_06218 [Bryopsis sp. KO-2023]|nr:hypothetical protein BSKO_06218 [Bryopsis sp. KO-2023]
MYGAGVGFLLLCVAVLVSATGEAALAVDPTCSQETQCWDSLCAPGVECFRHCTSSYDDKVVSSDDMNQETCCRGPRSGCEHLISPSGNPPTCYTDLCGGCAPRCYDSVTREFLGERMPYYEQCHMGNSNYANLA